jgi:hypothetical protein
MYDDVTIDRQSVVRDWRKDVPRRAVALRKLVLQSNTLG